MLKAPSMLYAPVGFTRQKYLALMPGDSVILWLVSLAGCTVSELVPAQGPWKHPGLGVWGDKFNLPIRSAGSLCSFDELSNCASVLYPEK